MSSRTNSLAHTVDRHATELAKTLLNALRPQLAGEARFDLYSRTMYATDASIYKVMPVGVVLPRTIDDVHATLAIARDHRVPVIPRGGGSSLEGQTTGSAIIVDFSKYMHSALGVNADEHSARVQPGLVLDSLNRALVPLGLMYGPDPASSNRATFGGMIGNNSTGAHSILYGMTHDHVKSLRVLLADGSETEMGALRPGELEAKLRLPGHEGRVYRLTHDIANNHRDEIAARYPRHWRAVSGYGLDRMVEPDRFNLASLLVGSEGTLAITLEATVNLVPRPARTALAVIHYRALDEAMESVPRLLEVEPSAIELIDHTMIELTRRAPEYARQLTFIDGEPDCVLIVEFYGNGERDLAAKLERLAAKVASTGVGYTTVLARTATEIGNVWGVRKAGLGLLMSSPSQWKPIPFIEDGSVPPDRLPDFVREVMRILQDHRVESAVYAHASAGCLHIRPMLNLKTAEDVQKMRSITEQWCEVILGLRGSFSGEHGDGRARSEWNEKLFGPAIYQAFRELKRAWDPANLLNPGNIVDGQHMTENLRYGPDYDAPDLPYTMLSFERFGGFANAVEMCSGVGVCRKTDEGVMCPSYMATREEEHSTRGRANALRGALSGLIPRDELLSPRMHRVLDLCLECKACVAECPTQVDMAKIKHEYLFHYHREHGLPARSWLFGNIRSLNRFGSRFARVSNRLAATPVAKWLQAKIGVAPERQLPPFAERDFFTWYVMHTPHPHAGKRGEVCLFPDTFTLYNYPSIGVAATRVLEHAGYSVRMPAQLACCGRPMISKGMLDQASSTLKRAVHALLPFARRGVPIVGMEPSCLLTFRDEAIDLLRSDDAALVASHAFMVDEWLAALGATDRLDLVQWRGSQRRLLLHGHCHHKAAGIHSALAALNLPPGYDATLIDSGCCGMAGSFGFEAEHYTLSGVIGGDRLFPALHANPEADIAVTGVSCRQQIGHFTGRQPRHLIEWLAEDLEG